MIEKIVLICLILYIIFGLLYYGVIFIVHKLFYKNCRRCKHCQLGNVASCGDGADYFCDLVTPRKYLTNRMVKYSEPIWKCCKKFEK